MGNLFLTDFEDSEHLIPGFPRFESGGAGENRQLVMTKVYQIAPSEFIPLLLQLPKKGRVHLICADGVWCWFQIDSAEAERLGSVMPSAISGAETVRTHSFLVRVTLKMSLLKQNADPAVPPWHLPAYNFRTSPVPLKTPVKTFYPVSGDPLLGESGSVTAQPFVSTAGLPLEAETTRPLTRFQFSYNIESNAENAGAVSEYLWLWPGHTNSAAVRFAGILFPPFSLRFESFSYQYCEERFSYNSVVNGAAAAVSGVYRFLKCDVTLLADPMTFVRNWLNTGVSVRTNGGLERLWVWNGDDGKPVFGKYADALKKRGAQEVADLLFLNESGDGISPFSAGGRQVPTYRRGVVLQPFDFNRLGLPEELPEGLAVEERL